MGIASTGARRASGVGPNASLHVIVLLWGLTAILGRQITIAAVPLVWYRLLGSVAVLAVVVAVRGVGFRIPRATALRYAAIGGLIGLHWVCFYAAIKEAGIATAVLTLSTVTFFTAVFEPLLFRRRVDVGELVIGCVVVVAASLLIQYELRVEALGLALGLGSALLASIFGVLNGKLAHREPPARLMFYELGGAAIVVGLGVVAWPAQLVLPPAADVGYLAILAVVCTVIPQVWIIHVLRTLSPFTVAVTLNLEPVYALILAAVLFPNDPAPSARFYAGAALLFGLVIVNGVRKARALG